MRRPLSLIAMILLSSIYGSIAVFAERNANRPPAENVPRIERQIEGWPVSIDPALLNDANRETGEETLKALANHLQRVRYIVSPDKLKQLQELPIWIDWHHPLGNMQYHPSRQWLVSNGYDPRLEKHIHIPRARRLLDPKQWAKHPYAVLHELAHAYHDQILGFDDARIRDVFKEAESEGIYEKVLLYTGNEVKHYALSNHKEYFAESTEAYFGVNDFYPFVRAELQQHDPRMFTLLQQIWGPVR